MNREELIISADRIIRDWLTHTGTACAIGKWEDGAIAELMLDDARLSTPRYDGPFSGLRDLNSHRDGHHVHFDLAQVDQVVYSLAPVVCFGWKPGFTCTLGNGIQLMFREPWVAGQLDETVCHNFLGMFVRHRNAYPDIVRLHVERHVSLSDATRQASEALLSAAATLGDDSLIDSLKRIYTTPA